MKWVLTFLVLMCILSGCATASQRAVAIPMNNQAADQVTADKATCEAFAAQYRNNDAALQGAGMGALIGGASGAAYGALAGAVINGANVGSNSLVGAALGAAGGLVVGSIQAWSADRQRYQRVFNMCLSQRGYAVTD